MMTSIVEERSGRLPVYRVVEGFGERRDLLLIPGP
jgi:hypothetical protein